MITPVDEIFTFVSNINSIIVPMFSHHDPSHMTWQPESGACIYRISVSFVGCFDHRRTQGTLCRNTIMLHYHFNTVEYTEVYKAEYNPEECPQKMWRHLFPKSQYFAMKIGQGSTAVSSLNCIFIVSF